MKEMNELKGKKYAFIIDISDLKEGTDDYIELKVVLDSFITINISFPRDYPFKPMKFITKPNIYKWLDICPCCFCDGRYSDYWSPAVTSIQLIEDIYKLTDDILKKAPLRLQAWAYFQKIKTIALRKEIKKDIFLNYIAEEFLEEHIRKNLIKPRPSHF